MGALQCVKRDHLVCTSCKLGDILVCCLTGSKKEEQLVHSLGGWAMIFTLVLLVGCSKWNNLTMGRTGLKGRPVDSHSMYASNYFHFTHTEDEEWNLVTCFCRRPFAGRPMIECSECGTWIHMFCANIPKDQVPEIYICPSCQVSANQAKGSQAKKPRLTWTDSLRYSLHSRHFKMWLSRFFNSCYTYLQCM